MTQVEPGPVRVSASKLQYSHEELGRLASVRAGQMAGRDSTYGVANVGSNHVGLLGEVATHRWFDSCHQPVEPLYLHPDSNGDLRVSASGMLVEVKTSRFDWWRDRGASLNAAQMRSILNEDALVWCVIGPELPTSAIYLVGWVSLPDLVGRVQPWVVRGNVAFKVSHLDHLESLVPWMQANESRFRWSQKAVVQKCARRHPGWFAQCLQCWWSDIGGEPNVVIHGRLYHREGCRELPERHGVEMASDAILHALPCHACIKPWLSAHEVACREADEPPKRDVPPIAPSPW